MSLLESRGAVRASNALVNGGARRYVRRILRTLFRGSDRVRLGPARGLAIPGGSTIMLAGAYEARLQSILTSRVRPGDTVWDVGANIGFVSVLSARLVGPEGHVVAFEPVPDNVKRVRAAIEVNHLTNLELVEAALFDEPGTMSLSLGATHTTGSITRAEAGADLTVEVTTFDAVADRLGAPDFVKMDIEGAEAGALRGATRLLAGRSTGWVIEVHSPELLDEVRALLDGHDLTVSGTQTGEVSFPCLLEASPR